MTVYRPLVQSGQYVAVADDIDSQLSFGSVTLGSGMGDVQGSQNDGSVYTVEITAAASGLIYVGTGDSATLGNDGVAAVSGIAAIAAATEAISGSLAPLASGVAAIELAGEAAASGQAALDIVVDANFTSNQAMVTATGALFIADQEITRVTIGMPLLLDAIASGEYALGSGIAANVDAAHAYASGSFANQTLIVDPFIDEDDLLGLIMALGN